MYACAFCHLVGRPGEHYIERMPLSTMAVSEMPHKYRRKKLRHSFGASFLLLSAASVSPGEMVEAARNNAKNLEWIVGDE